MSTWYRTSSWSFDIAEVEIERDTTESVWMNGSRRAKRGDHENYFSTKEAAINYLVEKYSRKVESAKDQLRYAEEKLCDLKEKYA